MTLDHSKRESVNAWPLEYGVLNLQYYSNFLGPPLTYTKNINLYIQL